MPSLLNGLLACAALIASFSVSAIADEPEGSLIDQALRAEVFGDNAKRNELLSKAVNQKTDDASARWNLGQVRESSGWRTVEAIAQASKRDKALAEYTTRREQSKPTFADQTLLARWCERNGLSGPAMAHWTLALRLDNSSRTAQRALGVTMYNGDWLTEEQASLAKEHDKKLAARSKEFKKELADLRRKLSAGDQQLVRDALAAIDDYTEPVDVWLLTQAFSAEPPPEEVAAEVAKRLVNATSWIDAPWAIDFAVSVALHSDDELVRDQAVESLRYRSLVEYAPALLARLRTAKEVSVQVTRNGRDDVVSYYNEYQEGPAGNDYVHRYQYYLPTHTRYYAAPIYHTRLVREAYTIPERTRTNCKGMTVTTPERHVGPQYETNWVRNVYGGQTLRSSYRQARSTQHAYQQAAYEQARAAYQNASQEAVNANVASLLMALTKQELPAYPRGLWKWWQHRWDSDAELRERDTQSQRLGLVYDLPSGLASGMLVQTRTGPRPIEDLQPGDEVFSKSPKTGELALKPVLQTAWSEGNSLTEVQLDQGQIAVMEGQWLWVSGSGWRLPQDVHTGTPVHGLNGSTAVASHREAKAPRVYSIVVADFHTFFAGADRVLLHDATTPVHRTAATPGWTPVTPIGHDAMANNANQ